MVPSEGLVDIQKLALVSFNEENIFSHPRLVNNISKFVFQLQKKPIKDFTMIQVCWICICLKK